MTCHSAFKVAIIGVLLVGTSASAALYRCNKNQGLRWDKSGSWDIWNGSAWVATNGLPTPSDNVLIASAAPGVFWTDDGNVDNDPLYIRAYNQQGYTLDNPTYWARASSLRLSNRPNIPRGLQIDGALYAAAVRLGYVSGADPSYSGNDTAPYTATVNIHCIADARANVNIGAITNDNAVAGTIFLWTQYGGSVEVGTIVLNTSLFSYQLRGGTLTATGTVIGTSMRLNVAGGTLMMNSNIFAAFVATGTNIQANGAAVTSGNLNTLLKVNATTSPGNVVVSLNVPDPAWNPAPAHGATSVAANSDLSWNAGAGAVSHNVYFGTNNPPPLVVNQAATSYDPGNLASNRMYYWRIDEVNANGTNTGTVWNFKTTSSGNLMRCTDGLGLVWERTGNWEIWNGTAWVKSVVLPTLADDVLVASAAAGLFWTYDFNHGNDPMLVRSYSQQGYSWDHPETVAYCKSLRVSNRPNVPRGLQIDGNLVATTIRLGYVSGADPTRPGNDTGAYTATAYVHATPDARANVKIGSIVNDNTVAGATFLWTQYGGNVEIGTITLNASLFNYQLQGGMLSVTGAVNGTRIRLNVAGGTLVMKSNVFMSLVANGTNIQANGSAVSTGNLDNLLTLDSTRYSDRIAATLVTSQVWNPSPAQGATNVAVNSDLVWSPGQYALSHDVYLGVNSNSVFSARRHVADITGDGPVDIQDLDVLAGQWMTTPGAVIPSADVQLSGKVDFSDFAALASNWQQTAAAEFKGNQPSASFDPGTLEANTTYFWRIDEVNPANASSPWVGTVRNFRTAAAAPPPTATKPSPGVDDLGIPANVTLRWAGGLGATSHDVYFGTNATLGVGDFKGNQTNTHFAPGLLANNTTFYWRIDEVNGYGTRAGTVWSFTTTPPRLRAEEFAIMPWDGPGRTYGPSLDQATLQTLSECGFNLAGFTRPHELDSVATAGLKGFVFDESHYVYEGNLLLTQPEIDQRVAAAVNLSGNHPGLIGYYLRDEPPTADFPELAMWANSFYTADPDCLAYINMGWPYAYTNFVQTVPARYLSYDFYGVLENGTINSGYFVNLGNIRAASKYFGIPFWSIVASLDMYSDNPDWNTAPPSPANLRFQLYTHLAYGARGIGWFTYFSGGLPSASIDMYGDKTPIWNMLRDVNLQMHQIGQAYKTLNNVNVFHYPNVSGLPTIATSQFVQSLSGGDFVAGEFTDPGGNKCVLLVNKSLTQTANFGITFKTAGTIYRVNSATGQWETLESNEKYLAAGEGMLLKLLN